MSTADTPPEYTSPLARAIAARSMPLLVRITALPRWVFVVGLTALLVGGLLLNNPIGGVLLLILATSIGWLLLLSWPVVAPRGRLLRLLVVLAVAGVGISQIVG